jgi:hypothetical protein
MVTVMVVVLGLTTASEYEPRAATARFYYLSWLTILGQECRCWSNICGILSVPFQWLIWYTALFLTNLIVWCNKYNGSIVYD